MKNRSYDKDILRIIDVNLNRAREGLRVCEEVVRFVLNDASLTKGLKSIRHKIQSIIKSADTDEGLLCQARNVKDDVGTELTRLEKRDGWRSIFFANMQRVKESLRVLEEFFKLFDRNTGERFKDLRFQVYEFEKKAIKRSKALSDTKHYS